MTLHPMHDAALLQRLTEIAVLISLFTVGFKLELPLSHARWRIPVQLASVSMLITVAAIAALGVLVMGLSLGAAVLLGGILAPTDPVLASDVQGTALALMGWFGIRGIGSIYYLLYAISHDIEPELAGQLLSITIAVVVASIVAHGLSVTPLMMWYEKGRSYWNPPP